MAGVLLWSLLALTGAVGVLGACTAETDGAREWFLLAVWSVALLACYLYATGGA